MAPTMRLLQTEYLLKGIYLGLVLIAALHLASIPPDSDNSTLVFDALLRVNLGTLVGLVVGLLLAALLRLRDSLRLRSQPITFLLFLLLENPTLAYLGILGGTLGGVYLMRQSLILAFASQPELAERLNVLRGLFTPVIGGSAIAGLAFGLLRQVRDRLARTLLIFVLAASLVAAGLSWLGIVELKVLNIQPVVLDNSFAFAWQLLLGIPFFYLLTFAGHEEESEIEIGIVCAMLGLGLGILLVDNKQMHALAFIVLRLHTARPA
jgi:hypothetical protein